MTRCLLPALVLFLAFPAFAGVHRGSKAPAISLKDQHGGSFELRSQEGRVIVLLAGDRAGSGQSRAWGSAIARRFGDAVTIIGIADTRGVPFFLRSSVAGSFRKDRVRILLDWQGSVCDEYGFASGTANIVVVDRTGIVRFVHAGELRSEDEALVLARIAEVLSP